MNNFMLEDIFGALCTLLAWFLVSTSQGFVLGYTSNVFAFRSLSTIKQLGLTIIFGTAILPCLNYLLANLAGINAVLVLDCLIFLLAIIIVFSQKHSLHFAFSKYRLFILSLIVWLLFSLLMLSDIQIGKSLFLPLTIFDHLKHIAVADTISRHGLPPANPFCYYGHTVPLRYYYYWHIGCAVINIIVGSPYNSRPSVLGGIIWIGIVFMAAIAFALHYFDNKNRPADKLVLAAIALLPIANIYFIVVPHFIVVANILSSSKLLTLNWWTEDQINPFLTSMLWVPHHIAGLIAGLTASIFLLELSQEENKVKRAWLVIFSALAMASCLGYSVYVAIGFIATWTIWSIILLLSKKIKALLPLLLCAILFTFLSLPLLHELWQITSEYAPLIFAIRKFELFDCLFSKPLPSYIQLLYFLLLPINYFCGFGLLLMASMLYWQRNTLTWKEPKELFLLVMFTVSLVLGTFIRSNAQNNNDFGWRIFLLSQFVLLIWSARYLCDTSWFKSNNKFTAALLKFLLIVGLISTGYDYISQRTAGAHFNPSFAYDMRAIYSRLHRDLPINAVVQHNPSPLFMGLDPYFALYAHRQVAVSVNQDGVAFAPNKLEYQSAEKNIAQLFQDIHSTEAKSICHRYGIDVILLRSTDPLWQIWQNKKNWLKEFTLYAENNNARAITIDSAVSSVDESSQSKNQ